MMTTVVKQQAKNSHIAVMVWAPFEERTASFAEQLNAPLYNVHYFQYKQPWVAPFKYFPMAVKTLSLLIRHRPDYVYITNPPAFAPFFVYLYCLLFGKAYVMDTHSPALYSRKWAWTLPLQRWLARRALVNIVDQPRYKALFESWGARAIVLQRPPERPIPFHELQPEAPLEPFQVAVINTFAVDEPLDIILEAARALPDIQFHITGDTSRANPADINNAPDNITWTGYLRGNDYWNLLSSTHVTLALTTYEYSLLGGAQDGVMLGKPLILSDQPVLREFFNKGTVFIENTTEGVINGVKQARAEHAPLARAITELAEEKRTHWQQAYNELETLLTHNAGH